MATVKGRLMLAELTERTEAAYTATTVWRPGPITADLPAVSGSAAALTRPTAGPTREGVVAVMGDVVLSPNDGTERDDGQQPAVGLGTTQKSHLRRPACPDRALL